MFLDFDCQSIRFLGSGIFVVVVGYLTPVQRGAMPPPRLIDCGAKN